MFGVRADASHKQIREAYIRISRVVHPDRFDQRKQPVEWRQANEMMKQANSAYEVLKDPKRRKQYDAMRTTSQSSGPGYQPSSPPQSASRPKERPKSAGKSDGPIFGSALFRQLPEEVQTRLLDRQDDKIGQQYQVQIEGVFRKYVWAAVLCGWFWFLFLFAADNRWSESAVFWFSLITVVASFFIGRQVHWIWRWHKSKLRCRFYVTPLYFIHTHLGEVKWWPLWKLKDLKVTHNYRNGGYQDTDIRLVFPQETEILSIPSKQKTEDVLDGMRYFDQAMRQAVGQERWDYFAANDDFRTVTSQPVKQNWLTRGRGIAYGLPLAIGLVLMLSAYNINAENPSLTGIPPQPSSSSSSSSQSSDLATTKTFNEPPQPLPYNGTVQRYHTGERLSPLEIRTRGQNRHYFVKVTDYYSDQPIATIFVRSGSSTEILVPLGTFRLKYATGQTWYGENYLFGSETRYSEADKAFYFTFDGYQYSGYTVELFLQTDGNLTTHQITPDQF